MTHRNHWFWRGMKHGINPCCILFFESAWEGINHNIPEYGPAMPILTNNAGIILCPVCIARRIMKRCHV